MGCPKFANRSQPLVGRSLPYCEAMWARHCCLRIFPLVDMCLSPEDIARQSCAMVPGWRIFGEFLGLAFPASRTQHNSDLPSQIRTRDTRCVYVCTVDIQSATAEIRRGKKGERKKKKKKETGQKYNVRICFAGRP